MHSMHRGGKYRHGRAAIGAALATLGVAALAIAGTASMPAAAAARGATRPASHGAAPASAHPSTAHASTAHPSTAAKVSGGTASPQTQGGPELARPGVIVNYPSASFPRLPDAQADAFILADADTGQILATQNPHAWYGPASTLKILTAISLIPELNPNATTVASANAVSQEENDVGLVQGQAYRIADLFNALLLISANDSAVALAEATGSYDRGIALMNAEAQHLQAYDTVAKTPNGLDAPGQHVSAYDQALIARQALQVPAFMTYDTTRSAWFHITANKWVQLINQDTLLDSYHGFLGGKIGWTTPAMGTYTGMARRNGHTLIVAFLHSIPMTWETTAPALLDWGFAAEGKVQPVGYLVNPLPPPAPPAPRHVARRSAAALHRASASSNDSSVMVPIAAALIGALAALGFGAVTWRLLLAERR